VPGPIRDTDGAARATRWVFLVCGVATATWAPMVPFAKSRLVLDEARLGLILLVLGGGAMVAMPLTGFLVRRVGSRAVTLVAALAALAMLPLLATAPTAAALTLALFAFGAFGGALDVAMNAHAIVVERIAARPLMSGFHALFSIGGLVGAAVVSALLGLGFSIEQAAWTVAGAMAVVVLAQARALLPHEQDASPASATFVLAHGRLLLLGVLCALAFLGEGAVLDWSAVFLRFSRGVSEAAGGLAYAAFSVTMGIGRLTGDAIVARVGPGRVLRVGALVAFIGFALATATPWAATAVAGFALVGVGASNVVPIFFSAAGRVSGVPPALALAAVTSIAYMGLLAGPALVGFIAHVTSLPTALAITGALFLVVMAGSRRALGDMQG
jgi:predicted MFS family arabinose efflux permease